MDQNFVLKEPTPRVYMFDPITREYSHEDNAFLDPLESQTQGRAVWIFPADGSAIKPPQAKEGFAIVWNGEAWEQVEDNRGKEFWAKGSVFGDAPTVMQDLGPLPDGASFNEPKETIDAKKARIRLVRDSLLMATDKYMVVDFPIADAEREVYKKYRAYLRDYTKIKNWWEINPASFEDWRDTHHV